MPVSPGDPIRIPAGTWNRLERMVGTPGGDVHPGMRRMSPQWRTVVPVKNSTGSDRSRGDVAAYADPEYSPEDDTDSGPFEEPILTAVEPSWPGHGNSIVVFVEPVEDGGTGLAAIDGLAWAKVDSGSGDYVRLQTAAYTLIRSSSSGAKAIGSTSAGGYCLVHLGNNAPGACVPTLIPFNFQNTGSAITYQTFNTETCETSGTLTLISGEPCTEEIS